VFQKNSFAFYHFTKLTTFFLRLSDILNGNDNSSLKYNVIEMFKY